MRHCFAFDFSIFQLIVVSQICAHIGLTKMQRCLSLPRLKVLWGRDGFWNHRHPLSFHIGQVRWQLRWYPPSQLYRVHLYTSSPIVAPSPWVAHLKHPREYLQKKQNTSKHPQRILWRISHISDNSLCCRRPS